MRVAVISKGSTKGKRLRVDMSGFPGMENHYHEFGSDIGKTYIDHGDDKKKKAWIARHSVNKNWDSMHSPIFWSRAILWGPSKSWLKNAKILAKKLKATIKIKL